MMAHAGPPPVTNGSYHLGRPFVAQTWDTVSAYVCFVLAFCLTMLMGTPWAGGRVRLFGLFGFIEIELLFSPSQLTYVTGGDDKKGVGWWDNDKMRCDMDADDTHEYDDDSGKCAARMELRKAMAAALTAAITQPILMFIVVVLGGIVMCRCTCCTGCCQSNLLSLYRWAVGITVIAFIFNFFCVVCFGALLPPKEDMLGPEGFIIDSYNEQEDEHSEVEITEFYPVGLGMIMGIIVLLLQATGLALSIYKAFCGNYINPPVAPPAGQHGMQMVQMAPMAPIAPMAMATVMPPVQGNYPQAQAQASYPQGNPQFASPVMAQAMPYEQPPAAYGTPVVGTPASNSFAQAQQPQQQPQPTAQSYYPPL